jgi:hypothetical protein
MGSVQMQMTDEFKQLLVELKLDGRVYMNKRRIAQGKNYPCDYGPPGTDHPHSGKLIPVIHQTFPSEFYLLCEAHAPMVLKEPGWGVYKCNG